MSHTSAAHVTARRERRREKGGRRVRELESCLVYIEREEY